MKQIINEHSFKLENFEGPIDLLLHLVKSKKEDIKKINVKEVTLQFIKIIDNSDINLEIAGDYLVTSSYFTELKSKKYLPERPSLNDVSKEEYERLEEEAIIKRIINYENFKNLSVKLKELNDISSMYVEKDYEKELINTIRPSLVINEENVFKNLNNDTLIKAALKLLEKEKENLQTVNLRKKKISIEERKKEIEKIFSSNDHSINFLKLFSFYDKHYISVTLLIVLELVRWEGYLINQDIDTKDIMITKPK